MTKNYLFSFITFLLVFCCHSYTKTIKNLFKYIFYNHGICLITDPICEILQLHINQYLSMVLKMVGPHLQKKMLPQQNSNSTPSPSRLSDEAANFFCKARKPLVLAMVEALLDLFMGSFLAASASSFTAFSCSCSLSIKLSLSGLFF